MRYLPVLALFFGVSQVVFPAGSLAGPIHETFVVNGSPSPSQIAHWNTLAGSRNYVFLLKDSYPNDFDRIADLRNAEKISIDVSNYPSEFHLPYWEKLRGKNVELVGLDTRVPTPSEIERLNRLGFSSVFFLTYMPSPEEASRLNQLTFKNSVTFATHQFPHYIDVDTFLAMPRNLVVTIAMDFWPEYVHMDTLNLIPQKQRLRILDIFPSAAEAPYLQNLKNVEEIGVETNFDADTIEVWQRFGSFPVRWTSKDHVPSEKALSAFEAGTAKSHHLTIDQDEDLTPLERLRLQKLDIPVEWIHNAPDGLIHG